MADGLNFRRGFCKYLMRKQRVAAAAGLLFVLGMPAFDLHAELLFRSFEPSNGQPHWSPLKKYASPADTAGSPNGNEAPADEVRVFLSGEITHADVASAAVMESLLKSGKQKIAGNAVWLASGGGDIDAGMELGRLLRRLGVFTVVARDEQCLSACVFAFMGGERRSVAGRLGIHRPYFPFTDDVPDRQARYRHLQQTLKSFIAELDFPDSLYEAVMLVPPESMQMLGAAELKRFFLEGISPSTEDIADARAARRLNLSMFEYLKRKALAPACVLPADIGARCEGGAWDAAATGVPKPSTEKLSGPAQERAPSGYRPF